MKLIALLAEHKEARRRGAAKGALWLAKEGAPGTKYSWGLGERDAWHVHSPTSGTANYALTMEDMSIDTWYTVPPNPRESFTIPDLDPSIPWSEGVVEDFLRVVRGLPFAHHDVVGGVESLVAQRKKLNESYQQQLRLAEEMANRANQAGEKLAQAERQRDEFSLLLAKHSRCNARLRQALKSFGLSDTIVAMLEE